MVLHMSNLEIMVAIEVVRRVNFWYIKKTKAIGFADGLDVGMMRGRENKDNLLVFELNNWVQGSAIYWKGKEWIWGGKLWILFCIANTEMLIWDPSRDIKYADEYVNMEFQRNIWIWYIKT